MDRRVGRDADLVARAREGDLDAFERLIARHRTRLLDLARQLVTEREAAQDLVQEAFLRAFRFLPSLREGDRFGPWIDTTMRRVSREWMRDGRRRPEPLDDEVLCGAGVVLWAPPSEPPEAVAARVHTALAALTRRERRVMILHYLEGRSCEEIARSLGILNGGVRRLLHYSRRKARTEVEMAKQAETAKCGPRPLDLWMSGDMSGTWGRKTVWDYVTWTLAQSMLLSANKVARSLPEMAEQVEAHLDYVEQMAARLCEMGLLAVQKQDRYRTTFIALDAEDWRRLVALLHEPAGAALQRLMTGESALREAFAKTPLAASGWSWEDLAWPIYGLLVCNVGASRHLPPAHRPAYPERPDGDRYWFAGREKSADPPATWGNGFNTDGLDSVLYGWLTAPDLHRDPVTEISYVGRDDRGRVVEALAAGPRAEGDLLSRLGGDAERWRGALARLVESGLAIGAGGVYRLTFPVFREGDSKVLTPAVDALAGPIVDEIVEPALAGLEARLDAMGYRHLRDQYGQWHNWLGGLVLSEALHFLLEQGVLPRPPDPTPLSFALIAWERDLPLTDFGK